MSTLDEPEKDSRLTNNASQDHPELAAEQAFLDHAHRRLEATRRQAMQLKTMVEVGQGGTNQARWEREVINENIVGRLAKLELGQRSLCFGRIDQTEESGGYSYHIGRIAVADADSEPLIVDWRAPVAEPFFRATGSDSMGLVRRRHFMSRGTQLLGLEDEFFGSARTAGRVTVNGHELRGEGALVAALKASRTGRLGDIVGTIQAEQDEIIRAPLPGILVVQGGPGTGKTVVALHRAAYLLYTHRFPLDGQGVLVIGPNRLFLGYIEQVLPSLGEAGVHLHVLGDLVHGVRVRGRDNLDSARIKGDLRMVPVLQRAVRDRQRPLRTDLRVGYGSRVMRMSVGQSERIVRQARAKFDHHNAARAFVQREVYETMVENHADAEDLDVNEVREVLKLDRAVREALEWMWPLLSPAQLLHDLFGSKALIRSAGRRLTANEHSALFRPWEPRGQLARRIWTADDVPLLDEARELLGRLPKETADDDPRTYGHIVVDEAQDLSPLQLRMLTRRSLNGSMTIVGDIAQSTGAWAHNSWEEILDHLPDRREPESRELTVGYRIPGPLMELAAKILPLAAPELSPPVSVRSDGEAPQLLDVPSDQLIAQVVAAVRAQENEGTSGNVAVIVPTSLEDEVDDALVAAGITAGRAPRDNLDSHITIVPVSLVKGLEVDTSIIVAPDRIVAENPQGYRSLYVAMTRATQRMVIIGPLPAEI